MPLFAMVGRNGPDAIAKRGAVRPRHLDYLKILERDGRLELAGPIFADDGTTPAGSLVVFESPSLETAKEFAAADPYVLDGVFGSHEVFPFTKVLPGGDA